MNLANENILEIVPGNNEMLNRLHRSRQMPAEYLDIDLSDTHTGRESDRPKLARAASRIEVMQSDDATARLRFLPTDETILGQHSMPAIAGRIYQGYVPGLWLENSTATAGGKILLKVDTLPPWMLKPPQKDKSAEEFVVNDTAVWTFAAGVAQRSHNISRGSGRGLLVSVLITGYTAPANLALKFVKNGGFSTLPIEALTNYASTTFGSWDTLATPILLQAFLHPRIGTPPAAGANVNFINVSVPRDTMLHLSSSSILPITLKITAQPLP